MHHQGSLLGPLIALLLEKAGEEQGKALARRLGAWALSSTVPSVESEVVVLASEAATVRGRGGGE